MASPIPAEAPVTITTAPFSCTPAPVRSACMDVIEAHVRRLPPIDERWSPRPCSREELERALVIGGVAGTASHALDNVRGNILMLIDGDPDKQFGLSGLPGG